MFCSFWRRLKRDFTFTFQSCHDILWVSILKLFLGRLLRILSRVFLLYHSWRLRDSNGGSWPAIGLILNFPTKFILMVLVRVSSAKEMTLSRFCILIDFDFITDFFLLNKHFICWGLYDIDRKNQSYGVIY